MLTMSRSSRNLILALAVLIASAGTANADGLGWWCYNGTCCASNGDQVSQPCQYGCDPDAQGYKLFVSC